MAKRRTIAIVYNYNESWIGGTYYIQNLIKSLNFVVDSKRPFIFVLTDSEETFKSLKTITMYPYLIFKPYIRTDLLYRFINKIWRSMFGSNLLSRYCRSLFRKIEAIFPVGKDEKELRIKNEIFWIPDLQEVHYPKFFTSEQIADRISYQKQLIDYAKFIVFSSKSALNDFNSLYKFHKLTTFILPFCVINDSTTLKEIDLSSYNLPEEYFICSNQFWAHKNHAIIFKALEILNKRGFPIVILFTGKEIDYRNPEYFGNLKDLVSEYNIQANVKFLGFIDRNDQLAIMNKSLGVVQPSLFEGWSTVVEDAKFLNKNILLSKIDVHLEQIDDYPNALLFSPLDANELAECFIKAKTSQVFNFDYYKSIEEYGNKFVSLLDCVCH